MGQTGLRLRAGCPSAGFIHVDSWVCLIETAQITHNVGGAQMLRSAHQFGRIRHTGEHGQ